MSDKQCLIWNRFTASGAVEQRSVCKSMDVEWL